MKMAAKIVQGYYTLKFPIRDLLCNFFFSQTADFPPFLNHSLGQEEYRTC